MHNFCERHSVHGLVNIELSTGPFIGVLKFYAGLKIKCDGIRHLGETAQLTCTIMWGFCENAGNSSLAHRTHIISINLARFPGKKITFVSVCVHVQRDS